MAAFLKMSMDVRLIRFKVISVDRNSRGGRTLWHAGELNAEGVRITLLERSRFRDADEF